MHANGPTGFSRVSSVKSANKKRSFSCGLF
jgi:hypothetical protein